MVKYEEITLTASELKEKQEELISKGDLKIFVPDACDKLFIFHANGAKYLTYGCRSLGEINPFSRSDPSPCLLESFVHKRCRLYNWEPRFPDYRLM